MPDCLNKTQIGILKDSLEDFSVNITKALEEETDPATIELYESTLDSVKGTESTINDLACVVMIGSGRGRRGM